MRICELKRSNRWTLLLETIFLVQKCTVKKGQHDQSGIEIIGQQASMRQDLQLLPDQ